MGLNFRKAVAVFFVPALLFFSAPVFSAPSLTQEPGQEAAQHSGQEIPALVPEQDFSGWGLTLGETHQGELLTTHPQMNDDTHADCFQLETTESNVYTVTLRSEDFDSYLLVGVGFCQDVLLQHANDDFEDGSLDAQIVFTAEYPFYSVYVNTFEPGAVGRYSLHVEERISP